MKEGPRYIKFPALKICQPIGDFYIGVMGGKDLVDISFADVRRMLDNEIDNYIGIQRRLSPQRSKDLKKYVNSFDATFPTSIIIAVDQENAEWDEKNKVLKLTESTSTKFEELAKIIDGQHRVEGLSNFEGECFEVNVSIFIGADIATQANIFATVNLAQTKVNRSLVYDLLSYEKLRSPQKSAHNIAVSLDQISFSPLHKRIKRLGTATPGREGETVTQAAVVEALLSLISTDPLSDRNSFFGGLRIKQPSSDEHVRHPFRTLFLNERESEITQIVLNFLTAVKERWPDAWDDLDRKGNVLPKTNGLKALMRFLKPLYLRISGEQRDYVPTKGEFRAYLDKVNLADSEFNTDTFKPGTSGESLLYSILSKAMEDQ